jgi:hypothetical protein
MKTREGFQKVWNMSLKLLNGEAVQVMVNNKITKKRKRQSIATNDEPLPQPEKKQRRTRQLSKKLTDYQVESTVGDRQQCSNEEDFHQNHLVPIIDKLLKEFDVRFNNDNLDLMKSFSVFDPLSTHFLNFQMAKPFIDNYKSHFPVISEFELNFAKEHIRNFFKDSKKISVLDVYNYLLSNKIVFEKVFKLFQIFLTLPVTSCSCERSFSTMRRTKTYLRNRMSDERLSSMCLLSIEKELSSTLNLDELTNNS